MYDQDLRVVSGDCVGIGAISAHWCRRSQVKMAKEISCGRATLGRSIGLGLLERGFARKGEVVTVFDAGREFGALAASARLWSNAIWAGTQASR